MIDLLVNNNIREIPTQAFVVQLMATDAFPDDENEVATLVHEVHFPVLVKTGLIEDDTERETIRYTGPESIADYFSKQR